ncbi:uncharacterized protein LOC110988156 [Acanthaster planci]|uniref:Uncharacterized protein LOC110988156 n=1 Tax=Acanthaster planci TaxID=133434 RepID=A0A8B7ZND8_ACAPL|nr:uncharacterized protein LOC110988156 [Acanthaster planci]
MSSKIVLNGELAPGSPTVARSGDITNESSLDRECENLTRKAAAGADQGKPQERSNGVVTPPLPKGCVPLTHQVAGHMYGKGTSKAGNGKFSPNVDKLAKSDCLL